MASVSCHQRDAGEGWQLQGATGGEGQVQEGRRGQRPGGPVGYAVRGCGKRLGWERRRKGAHVRGHVGPQHWKRCGQKERAMESGSGSRLRGPLGPWVPGGRAGTVPPGDSIGRMCSPFPLPPGREDHSFPGSGLPTRGSLGDPDSDPRSPASSPSSTSPHPQPGPASQLDPRDLRPAQICPIHPPTALPPPVAIPPAGLLPQGSLHSQRSPVQDPPCDLLQQTLRMQVEE